MSNDCHQRSAEFHELASHAHLATAVHHGKEERQAVHEHSEQAMEYTDKAIQWSEDAHRKFQKVAGRP
jgi:hypothetical protein